MMPRINSPAAARHRAGAELLAASGLLALLLALARRAAVPRPTALDRAARRVAMRHRPALLTAALAPLDPLGYPGGYIPIAHLCARWLRRRGVPHHRALVVAAWAGWIAHRLAKLVYERERPPRGVRVKGPKLDSFPSGHTTGATTFALTAARILAENGILSREQALMLGLGAPLVMGASRVYADVHWATDVAGGWLLGAAVAFSLGALLDVWPQPATVRERTGSKG